MDHSWGRQASAGTWISTRPAWAYSAALLAVVSVIGLGQYRYSRWTPLQQFYFPAYVRSTMLDALGFTKPGRYALLTVVDPTGAPPRCGSTRLAPRSGRRRRGLTGLPEQ